LCEDKNNGQGTPSPSRHLTADVVLRACCDGICAYTGLAVAGVVVMCIGLPVACWRDSAFGIAQHGADVDNVFFVLLQALSFEFSTQLLVSIVVVH
jgi:hypothetical protein